MISRKLILLPCIALLICGFGSCSGRIADVCSARTEMDYQDALLALRPTEADRRELASIGRHRVSLDLLEPTDRERWQLWSQNELKQAQNYMDLTENEPSLHDVRQELSTVADDFVIFNGFAHEGRKDRMLTVLEQIQTNRQKIRALVCR